MLEYTLVDFKIDTGANVTVVPMHIYEAKLWHIKLKNSNKVICGSYRENLDLAGLIQSKLKDRDFSYNDNVYIINNLQPGLNLHGSSRELNSHTSFFFSVNFYIFEGTHGSSSVLRSRAPSLEFLCKN